jgi:hypothetical protein
MSPITRAGLAALLVTTAATAQIPSAADWDRADAQTVRLAPDKLDALPLPIRQELARLGCTVPQVWAADRPGNFITGRFSSSSQTEIAVLCSRNRISSILVFGTGSTKPIAEIAETPDKDFLQVVDAHGRIGFSRALAVAHPQAMGHDGIDDAFAEKGSRVWYWHEGRWMQLTGSD